jgi:hypothetical protein
VAQASETRERFFFVRFHEPRITGDIGSNDLRAPSRNRFRAQNRFPRGARLDRSAARRIRSSIVSRPKPPNINAEENMLATGSAPR